MTILKFLTALRRAKAVYVWVAYCEDEGTYVKAIKADVRRQIVAETSNFPEIDIIAHLNEDGEMFVG
jgi:predicted short-subunit dehydrogenase-like oxidoreductase (DUF2520 family)